MSNHPKFYRWQIIVAVLALTVLAGVDAARAQYQTRTYARSDVERFIRDVEQSSQEFQRDFDTRLDRSNIDGQRREDVYNRQVQDLSSSLSTLRSNFNRRNDWWLARNDMQRVLSAATNVNSFMSSREVRGGGLNRQWTRLRTNINTLANAFNLPQVGTTFSGIQTYPGGNNYRACSLTGTFRGNTNTGEVELAISSNGTAVARSLVNGASYSGRCANDVLYFDWGTFNLVREGRNNIATVEIGNERNRTTYRRVSGSSSGDTNSGYPNQYGNVPAWAVGTFRGMTNDGEAEITLRSDGVAFARSLVTNQVFNGRYANDLLTFDWGSFRLVRESSGIRAIEVGQRTGILYQRVSSYPGDSGTYPNQYPNQNQYGNVPSWAVGRFRGLTDNGEAELTISSDGSATVRSLVNNAMFTGQFGNDVLTFDWGSFRLVRGNGGITLVEVGKQSGLFYRRVD